MKIETTVTKTFIIYLGQNSRIERPPVATGVCDHNVMVLIDSDYSTGGAETLEHSVRPSTVPVLQGLHYF